MADIGSRAASHVCWGTLLRLFSLFAALHWRSRIRIAAIAVIATAASRGRESRSDCQQFAIAAPAALSATVTAVSVTATTSESPSDCGDIDLFWMKLSSELICSTSHHRGTVKTKTSSWSLSARELEPGAQRPQLALKCHPRSCHTRANPARTDRAYGDGRAMTQWLWIWETDRWTPVMWCQVPVTFPLAVKFIWLVDSELTSLRWQNFFGLWQWDSKWDTDDILVSLKRS